MPFTEEQLAEIRTVLGETLKGDDFKTVLTEGLGGVIKGVVKTEIKGLKLDDRFADLDKKITPSPDDDLELDEPDDKPPKGESKDLRKLRAELATLKQRAEQSDAEAKRARQERAQARLNQQITDALAHKDVGIPEGQRRAVAALLKEEGIVGLNEDGEPVWRTVRAGTDIEVGVSDGVLEWAKTDAAKVFRPAKATGGTGGTDTIPAPTPRTQAGSVDWSAAASALINRGRTLS